MNRGTIQDWTAFNWCKHHIIGDENCKACLSPPPRCDDCGGLVHVQIGGVYEGSEDEMYDHCCDTCFANWEL